jgi:hypothetical protein
MTSLLFTLLIIAAILFVISIAFGIFFVLIQLGVIAQKAIEPPTVDDGDYSLAQGRDVGGSTVQTTRKDQ